jgi:hypothetical protein
LPAKREDFDSGGSAALEKDARGGNKGENRSTDYPFNMR